MITIEQAAAAGIELTPFVDSRRMCKDCKFVSLRPFKGKCHKGKIQYIDLLNNCVDYAEKIEKDNGKFWE